MSRVTWGHVTPRDLPGLLGGSAPRQQRQATLDHALGGDGERKRPRDSRVEGGGDDAAPPPPPPDDDVMWGPSGGANRETQGRRLRPFMAGRERRAVFGASPYSREYVAAWKDERRLHGNGAAAAGSSATTEFDDALLQPFLPHPMSTCPRDVFAGKVFFLNSCDADPAVSTYILEKLIRFLGGHTAMGINGAVTYVVAQHLASSKEDTALRRRFAASSTSAAGAAASSLRRPGTGARLGGGPVFVHPHFVLACAERGALVPVARYRTIDGVAAPPLPEQAPAPTVKLAPLGSEQRPASAAAKTVLVDDDDDDDDGVSERRAAKAVARAKKETAVAAAVVIDID